MYTATSPGARPRPLYTERSTPTVFVVDDDVSMRESLELLITHAGWQPELFSSAEELLTTTRPASPSCLVLDMGLNLTGLELQRRIVSEWTGMPIIFISGCGDVPMTVQAMKAGAIDFMTKPFAPEALLMAIEIALERSRVSFDKEANLRVIRERYQLLSRREREVMEMVVCGLLNKQIAGQLGISEITVKAHRGSMTRKMRTRSLPELVTIAARLGIEVAGNS